MLLALLSLLPVVLVVVCLSLGDRGNPRLPPHVQAVLEARELDTSPIPSFLNLGGVGMYLEQNLYSWPCHPAKRRDGLALSE